MALLLTPIYVLATHSGVGNVTFTIPGGYSTARQLVVIFGADINGLVVTPPGAFTQIANSDIGGGSEAYGYIAELSAAPAASYAFSCNNDGSTIKACLFGIDPDGDTYLGHEEASSSADAQTDTSGNITPNAHDQAFLLAGFFHDNGGLVNTAPSGMTGITGTPHTGDSFSAGFYHQENPAGSPINKSITWDAGEQIGSILVLLEYEASGATTVDESITENLSLTDAVTDVVPLMIETLAQQNVTFTDSLASELEFSWSDSNLALTESFSEEVVVPGAPIEVSISQQNVSFTEAMTDFVPNMDASVSQQNVSFTSSFHVVSEGGGDTYRIRRRRRTSGRGRRR